MGPAGGASGEEEAQHEEDEYEEDEYEDEDYYDDDDDEDGLDEDEDEEFEGDEDMVPMENKGWAPLDRTRIQALAQEMLAKQQQGASPGAAGRGGVGASWSASSSSSAPGTGAGGRMLLGGGVLAEGLPGQGAEQAATVSGQQGQGQGVTDPAAARALEAAQLNSVATSRPAKKAGKRLGTVVSVGTAPASSKNVIMWLRQVRPRRGSWHPS